MTHRVTECGAERGLLILIRDGEPRIEAEATTGPGKIEVAVRQAADHAVGSAAIRAALCYPDAGARTPRRCLDRYRVFKGRICPAEALRSVLCLPIVRQAKFVGALYLENNLAPCVFTSDRVALLQLLASQAAISLENAHLYSDLQLQAACCSDFLCPPGRSSQMGHRTS